MTDYAWPSAVPNPASMSHQLVTNTKQFRSPLTGSIQTASRAGERWLFRMSWLNLSAASRAELQSMLFRLTGKQHRQLITMDKFAHAQRGAYGGTPVVDGAAQTGETLNIRGASLSVTTWAAAGDWLQFDGQLVQVMADADSDGTGDVALDIRPRIRVSPADGTTLETASASVAGSFILQNDPDFQNESILAGGVISSTVTAEFLEDLF